jgi:anti-sigma B factor antagonist
MELEYSELDNGIRLIKLIGKLDSAGYNSVDLKFTAHCSGDNIRVLVDLSEVSFLASIGIRMLTMNAKSLSTREGKLVLLNPQAEVQGVLDMTGISPIIPIFTDLESATAALTA